MSTESKIEWTDRTWNPTTGCSKISPGCDNCYALSQSKRLKAMGAAKYQTDGDPVTSGPGFGVAFHDSALTLPLQWRKPRRVFVNSMSDIGHAQINDTQIARIFAVMAAAEQHTFQVLTKRPKRIAKLLTRQSFVEQVHDAYATLPQNASRVGAPVWPLPNVWMGTSIESDDYCWRADELRATPAAMRFLSLEPLLGPLPSLDLTGIDWVIVGGESGSGHRDLDLDWVRDIRDRRLGCATRFFFKQVGGVRAAAGGRLLDGRTWDEMPELAGPR
ncbi:phage Gp37/Gp68 family protein [Rhodococcus qingshengii]|uniref:DUF5131 family protein n=1 Tax=Rhodococcus qingshengii TaxID=334542 RepID=UPI0030192F2B